METLTEALKEPQFLLHYGHKDITAFITPYVLSVTYTDKLTGESDELEVSVEDTDGKWRGDWYPEKGDELSLKLGYKGEPLLPCGEFQLDEVEYSAPPDVVTLRGLASGITGELRTKATRAYETQTLRQVAQQVAARHGLVVTGKLGELKLDRITQNAESDLAFLKRLAESYGYAFSVRGKQLVFHELADLDARGAVLVIPRSVLKQVSLRDKTDAVYRACTVQYHDPQTGKLIKHTEKASGVTEGDVLNLTERCESRADAEAKAKAALRRSHGRRTEGTLTLEGNPRLVSGNNVELTDMGRLNGLYQIRQARHVIDRGAGYSTEIEVSRV